MRLFHPVTGLFLYQQAREGAAGEPEALILDEDPGPARARFAAGGDRLDHQRRPG